MGRYDFRNSLAKYVHADDTYWSIRTGLEHSVQFMLQRILWSQFKAFIFMSCNQNCKPREYM